MNNPRQRLRQLVEELKLPLIPEEVEENMSKLSDEQVESLVFRYEQVKKYQDEVDGVAKEKNPEEYKKITEEYDEKEAKLEEKHLNDLQKIHEEADKKLDEAEETYSKELEATNEEVEETTNAVVDVLNTMTDKAKELANENNQG